MSRAAWGCKAAAVAIAALMSPAAGAGPPAGSRGSALLENAREIQNICFAAYPPTFS